MILITRPKKDSLELQEELKKLKINSIVQELSTFKISKSRTDLSNSIVLITSLRSIDYLVKTKTLESCKRSKFLVIGKLTAQRLMQLGCKNVIITASDSGDLLIQLKRNLKKNEIIKFLCSNIFNKELIKSLKKLSYNVELLQVYETHSIKRLKKSVVRKLKHRNLKAAIFFSQYSLKVFLNLCKTENIERATLKKLHYICISKRVADPAIRSGFNVHLPNEPTKASIFELVQTYFA